MGNNTGMILEFKGNKAIVITNTCDFITLTRMPEMFVGQQVDLNTSVISKKSSPLKYCAIAGMFVLILCSVLIYQLLKPSAVFAYVDVDINPSLELSIDKNSNVIAVKALNNDAAALVKNRRLTNKSLTSALKIILEESQNKGYIRPDAKNSILISASIKPGKSDSSAVSNEKALDGIVSELQKTDFSAGSVYVKSEVIKVDPSKRSEAIKNNISMGRYKLLEEISESGDVINIEQGKSESISNMISSYEAKKQNKTTSDKKKDVKQSKNPKSSKGSSVKLDKAKDQVKVLPSDSADKPSNNSDSSENTTKESPDKKETFDQGSKPIPIKDDKNVSNATNYNNGNNDNEKQQKNNPSSEKKEENRNSNHNEKGKNQK